MKTGKGQFAYFGYGSLVNRATHQAEIIGYSRATLKGWRRHWLPRPRSKFGHVALLSIYPDLGSEIDGIVVTDHLRNLPALDQREIRYDRIKVPADSLSIISAPPKTNSDQTATPITIYKAKTITEIEDGHKCRILRSYLDAVMQGYLNKFGAEGLHRFIATTDNFEIGILDDRSNPVYSRPVILSRQERILFDDLALV